MAETQRSIANLLARLPDNVDGDISPEDVRDIVATLRKDYASVYASSPSLVVIPGIGTWVDVTQNMVASASLFNFTVATGAFTYVGPSIRHVTLLSAFSMTVGANNQVMAARIVKNGVVIPGSEVDRKVSTGADVGAAACMGFTSMVNGDVFKLQMTNNTSTANITLNHCNFAAEGSAA